MSVTYRDYVNGGGFVSGYTGYTLKHEFRTQRDGLDDWRQASIVTVWDLGSKAPKEIESDTYVIDAHSSAVVEYIKHCVAEEYDYVHAIEYERAKLASLTPAKGTLVRVVGGRDHKQYRGKEYPVFHVMKKMYSQGPKQPPVERPMCGLALTPDVAPKMAANGKTYDSYVNTIWVWSHNLEVVNSHEILLRETAQAVILAKKAAAEKGAELIRFFTAKGMLKNG